MKRELLILRHGKSDWSVPVSDFNRPLKKRGIEAAGRIGQYLGNQGRLPDYVLSSPAARARQTTELVCDSLEIPAEQIRFVDSLYHASYSEVLSVIQSCPHNVKRLLIVGHNPALENVVFYLPDCEVEMEEGGKLLPTGALAILEHEQPWSDLQLGVKGKLSLIKPRNLP